MKKLSLIIIGLLFINCSSDEESDCSCQKLTYRVTVEQVNTGGTVQTQRTEELLSTENVVCQDEATDVPESDNTQFDIQCN